MVLPIIDVRNIKYLTKVIYNEELVTYNPVSGDERKNSRVKEKAYYETKDEIEIGDSAFLEMFKQWGIIVNKSEEVEGIINLFDGLNDIVLPWITEAMDIRYGQQVNIFKYNRNKKCIGKRIYKLRDNHKLIMLVSQDGETRFFFYKE